MRVFQLSISYIFPNLNSFHIFNTSTIQILSILSGFFPIYLFLGKSSEIEQAQEYFTWMERKQIFALCSQNSWEEKAFAQDASGLPGGCIGAPRCYPCTFCQREFKSAQALGGHMNIHRRDRARLKQSVSPQGDNVFQRQNQGQGPVNKSMESRNKLPSEFSSSDYELGPKSGSGLFVSSSVSSSRVSGLSFRQNPSEYGCQEHRRKSSKTCNLLGSVKLLNIPDSRNEQYLRIKQDRHGHDHSEENGLRTGMKPVSTQNPPSASCSDEAISTKRPRVSALSLSIKPCSNDMHALQAEVIRPNSNSMEDIDLELRIGEPPRVK
ncbi:hypothetical protein K2173_012925 [Erythroxylum novogranatense]|uniref:C2H2-type domain-containing protein n=1 Tax=Erythroxylum novogranatense TaxID=1862640 RepID=A0AAV8S5M6_9ROSI|nr:hypothetical protein K2173_012925 [Erythroxylum novogranatense]